MIYVMRHGQSVVNVERRLTCRELDGDLTDLGREQASKAASWFMDKGITAIYVSPFHRAQQTSEIISKRLGITATCLDGLREIDCGDFTGRTGEQAWAEWHLIYDRWLKADWEATFPGGESYREGYRRYSACFNPIQPEGSTLFVTHGGITTTVLPYLCVNVAALQGSKHLDNTGTVVLEPYDAGRYICRSWNLMEHL